MPEYVGLNSSNLFEFDERLLRDHILADNSSGSGIEYDEYVVYKRGSGATTPSHGDLAEHQPQGTISHRFNQADIPGFEMLNLAFRQDYLVDQDGAFATSDQLDSSMTVHGRVRRVVCFRRGHSFDRVDGLSITSDDLTAMDLHPATLQYSRRTTTEGRFWSVDKSKIYSKMAQENNMLNARMAVSATRDSSSMTALAVITAVFLPGEYVSGLFGMSMFDWQASGEDASGRTNEGGGAPVAARDSLPVLSHLFWVYWATAIPLTLCVLIMWRIWWVRADRSFRRRLSRELSERRIWTKDGRPRDLEHSFWYDFFFLTAMGYASAEPLPLAPTPPLSSPAENTEVPLDCDASLHAAR
ncbi:hypothetical protein HYQ45_018782 [Verticillium longisporum]|uniref:Uncharacterized protein n=1 Tax=Verticillium longisporum TaxID=100787 RepID=A0A8I3A438_VERLO|nr:hypothetical protein HYQ45_018782 [Verticillium longisporum]